MPWPDGVRCDAVGRAGELRRSQNWIGPAGSTLASAAFVPPPHQDIPDLVGNLEVFLHHEDGLPFLIKVGLAHAQFETIHPFLHGNGRVGRLLITFLLTERNILQKPVLISLTTSSGIEAPTTTAFRRSVTTATGRAGLRSV